MLIAERQNRLQELLARRGMADLDSLAAELDVSQSTVRRDVEALELRGLARRTHGGVIWLSDRTNTGARPYAFDQRITVQLEAKKKIARAAKSLCRPGQTVLIDGGTTTFHLAEELLGQTLQLVTNSLPIANLFINDDQIEVVLTGGLMYPRYGVLLGPAAENFLADIHTQIMFLSVAGISGGALYNQNLLLVQAERRMMDRSQEIVLLADTAKFGQQSLVKLADLSEIDVVVTDGELPVDQQKEILDAGCRLIIADQILP